MTVRSEMGTRRSTQPARSTAHAVKPPAPSSWHKAAYVGLFICLALIAAQCVRLGMAGLLVQSAQGEVDTWTPSARKPSMAQIRHAAKFYTDSLAYFPDNPWSIEGMGAVDLARMRASANPREALAVTRSASARFRRALALRPTSPFLWANLALAKLYLEEIDAELLTALRHADELGPWEPTVQQTVLFVGLAVWQDLDPGLRQALQRTVERGALRNSVKMFEIVKSYTRLDLVCAIEKYRIIAGPHCSKTAENAKPG